MLLQSVVLVRTCATILELSSPAAYRGMEKASGSEWWQRVKACVGGSTPTRLG